MAWRYLRICKACKELKQFATKNSVNNKYRCPDCLEKLRGSKK